MRRWCNWLAVLAGCLVGCHRHSPKNAADAQKQEFLFAVLVASTKFQCDFAKIVLDEKNKEVSGNKTIYPGTACGEAILVICETTSYHKKPALACGAKKNIPSNRPADKTVSLDKTLRSLLEPCRIRALATYPEAKERYLAGLPKGYEFSVVVKLKDSEGRKEQVFLSVTRIYDGKIEAKIDNQIEFISGYKLGQAVTVQESEIVDWVIVRPDGSEEGNLAGKFIDAYQESGQPPTGICDQLD
jgi:hypothetical protein